MPTANATAAVSAPGKVLLAGGYLVLSRRHTGLVFGLSARISVVAGELAPSEPGVQLSEIVVRSPQFREAEWRYGYRLAPEGGGIQVTQLQVGPIISPNTFVETTLSYALTFVDRAQAASSRRGQGPHGQGIKSSRLIILADDDYYSQSTNTNVSTSGDKDVADPSAAAGPRIGRFKKFPVTLKEANKTGLGSSAALVTALTASLLTHYLPRDVFDITSEKGSHTLHNLAQAAHCAAQGKVGSGFDVAAAVFGSCTYRRFSPEILSKLPEPGAPGFSASLYAVVNDADDKHPKWDVEVRKDSVSLPAGLVLRMCDVTCGSQTVGMVKQVLAWRSQDAETSSRLWDDLQSKNDLLAKALKDGALDELPGRIGAIRERIREMGKLSGVPIEPESQTALLDAVSQIDGVYGGVVPGAGGHDAVALLMKDDEGTTVRVERFLAEWSSRGGSQVRLLSVEGEMEGVRRESLDDYAGWLS